MKKYIFISLVQFRHYLIDVSKVNKKYQQKAAEFKLRSLYPCSPENAVYDIVDNGNKKIGIATTLDNFNDYKDIILVSPLILIKNAVNDGICFFCVDNSFYYLDVIDKCIINFEIFSNFDVFKEAFRKKMLSDDKKNKYFFIFDDIKESLVKNFSENKISIVDVRKRYDKKIILKSAVFCHQNDFRKPVYLFLFIFVISVFINILFFNNFSKNKKCLKNLKQEYMSNKKDVNNTHKNLKNNDNKQISIGCIVGNVLCASDTIKLNSFSIKGNAFQFEAENAMAISVLEFLNHTDLFEDVIIMQSEPFESQEKFIISGKIK